jgi:hypothetical protein
VTTTTSCNLLPSIDLLDKKMKKDKVLCNNYVPINLHLDTIMISWSKISEHMDLSQVPNQANLTEKFTKTH